MLYRVNLLMTYARSILFNRTSVRIVGLLALVLVGLELTSGSANAGYWYAGHYYLQYYAYNGRVYSY